MNKVTSQFPTKYFIILSQCSPLLFWRQGWIAGEQKEGQKKEKKKRIKSLTGYGRMKSLRLVFSVQESL